MLADRLTRARAAVVPALALLLAVLVGGVGGAGCAQIPTSGPIEEGEPVSLEDPAPYVQIVATAPQRGDSQLEIVRGFFEAMASYSPDYPTARLFLAPRIRDAWRPQAGVTVYDGSAGLPVVHAGRQQVRVSAPKVATIGRGGTYERAERGSRMRLRLTLTRSAGEWRIARLPQGLVMSAYDVAREYVGYNLYFFDPSYEVVVPDRVFLPRNANTATLLVQSLLDGPTRWLAPAVRTAFPDGTRLQVSSAPVVDGLVQVPLSAEAAGSTTAERDAMSAQLVWTLRQAPGVTAVRVSIDGVPLLRSGDDSGVLTVDSWQRYDAELLGSGVQPYAVEKGRVGRLTRGVLRPVEGPFGDRSPPLRSVGAGLEGDAPLAAVSDDGTKGWLAEAVPGARQGLVVEGRDLATPSWDRTGLVWFVDRGARRPLQVFQAGDPAGGRGERIRQRRIRVPESLAGEDVRALRVSRDGVRVAIVVSAGGAERLVLAAVVRDAPPEGRRALRLTGVRTISLPFTSIRDVVWADRDQVAVLARVRGEEPQVYLVEVAGPSVDSLGAVGRPVRLAAAPQQPFLLSAADGKLYRLDDTFGWTAVTAGTAPAYPG